ncbi:hypothetical protein L9F63_024309, partial [Diploptera punctata]
TTLVRVSICALVSFSVLILSYYTFSSAFLKDGTEKWDMWMATTSLNYNVFLSFRSLSPSLQRCSH